MRLAFPALLPALAKGGTIVTPTPLLASIAAEQFNRAQLSQGIESWETANILSLDVWMANCWRQISFSLPNAPSLLSPSQELELWRQIIEHDRPDLFDLRAMAGIARRAARLLAEYQIPTEGDAWMENPDAAKFLRWYQLLQQRLKSENWITRSDLWRLLSNAINKGLLTSEAVTFAALTSVSPGLKRLEQRLAGLTPSIQPIKAKAQAFDSVAQEIEHAARASRYLLENDGVGSIGILVVDFKAHAADVKRIFSEIFYPSEAPANHFHLQSESLLTHPLISSALLLLELAKPRIPHYSAGAILRSNFIEGAAKERTVRALAESRLRRARELDFSLADLETASTGCAIFSNALKRVRGITFRMLPVMRLSDWSSTFSDLLEAARWPTLESITESESRALDQWNKALSDLAALNLVSPPVTLTQALAHLRAILSVPSHHGDWSSRVQVLDAAESEGIEFDQVFLLNAAEDLWPPPVVLSPLIPYQLQRLHDVPGSRSESAAEERLRKTRSLFTTANHIQVSFTGKIAPALHPYVELGTSSTKQWTGLTAAQSYLTVALDCQEDSLAPPLSESTQFRGGSGVIKAQSLCPFRAFAEYRLLARGDEEACFGFDALERGTFVHKALELVWRHLQTQAALKALPPDKLLHLVEQCVTEAVHTDNNGGPIHALTSAAEHERLTNVLLDWLAIERARLVPFSVEYVEEKREVDLSGLKLTLRVDRIDRLPNGSLVLIDYKSGIQSKNKLEGVRPKEPQLLVYAAAVADPVDGLYFAELKNRNARAVGYGSGKHFYKQATREHKNWDGFLQQSNESVHRLAQEFKAGEAAVKPQGGACDYCKVKPVCRIQTAGPAEDDEE